MLDGAHVERGLPRFSPRKLQRGKPRSTSIRVEPRECGAPSSALRAPSPKGRKEQKKHLPQGEGHILQHALHPLDHPPAGPGWNQHELTGLLPANAPLREAAVLLGLIKRPGGLSVLLTRRTDGLRQHAGQVSFPGGVVDAHDADALTAALREAHEEIGLPPTLVQSLGWLDPLATITGYRVLPLVAEVDPGFVPVPHPAEVADVFEVELGFLLNPEHLRTTAWNVGGRARHVLEFSEYPGAPGQRIWGATASILFNLRQRLQAPVLDTGA